MRERSSTRATCIVVDLENYSTLDGLRQAEAQQALADALAAAAARAGLRRFDWQRQPAGDGELAVLPDTEPLTEIVSTFPLALDAVLRAWEARGGLRLRVRMAMIHGLITAAAFGYADHAVVAAARIADAPPVRRALASAPHGRVVLALSTELYRDVIKHGGADLTADQFRRVVIERIEGEAWITIPGVDPDELLSDPPPHDSRSDEGVLDPGGDGYQTVIQGSVHTSDFHIGPRHG